MSGPQAVDSGAALARALNRAALVLALLVLAGLGAWWLRERTRPRTPVRWEPEHFAMLRAGEGSLPRPTWIVAVNPGCPHCIERLAELRARHAAAAAGAALGVLLVDVPQRPESLAGGAGLDAGVWWDSSAVWRRAWGHGIYGEVLVFAADGRLQHVFTPADSLPAPRR